MTDITKELTEANARLPINLADATAPLHIQMRTIALTIAQRHVGDTCVKEGGLYNALKMDNKLGNVVSIDDVVRAALIFERYLWGEWSKGIAEDALESVMADVADVIEEIIQEGPDDEPPIRPSCGDVTP